MALEYEGEGGEGMVGRAVVGMFVRETACLPVGVVDGERWDGRPGGLGLLTSIVLYTHTYHAGFAHTPILYTVL